MPQAGPGFVQKVLVRHVLCMLNLSHITSEFVLLPSFHSQAVFHTKHVDMFVIYFYNKFNVPRSSGSFVITKKLKANENFVWLPFYFIFLKSFTFTKLNTFTSFTTHKCSI
jgi:hypothetical protein